MYMAMASDAFRQRQREQEAGKRWFAALPDRYRGQLGDDLVLGAFDWRDWTDLGIDKKPSPAFMNAVARELEYWELECS